MQMLGRDAISSPATGVVELVKNAYDADAQQVDVMFAPGETEMEMIISDNGDGMTRSDIEEKWLVISTGNKQRSPLTTKGRKKVGEKGIGRLVLDRLATHTKLATQHQGEGTRTEIFIEWSKYEVESGDLGDITHPIQTSHAGASRESGTTITLSGLRDEWTRVDFVKLRNELSLLVPPFSDTERDFSISLHCPYDDLSGPIHTTMIEAAEMTLEADLSSSGTITTTITNRSSDSMSFTDEWRDAFGDVAPGTFPLCGPIRTTLHLYLRQATEISDAMMTKRHVVQFLDRFQGIRVYRDGFWVRPYGEPGENGDWLSLNARRVGSPGGVGSAGYRIAGNQIVGEVHITKEDNMSLYDQTNREGLVDNVALNDLRKFMLFLVQKLERYRVTQHQQSAKIPRQKPDEVIERFRPKIETVKKTLERAIEGADAPSLFPETPPVTELRDALKSMNEMAADLAGVAGTVSAVQTEQQLLHGLATTGIAMVAFGHETAQPVTSILNRVTMSRRSIDDTSGSKLDDLRRHVEVIEFEAQKVQAWGQYALGSMKRDRRQRKKLNVNEIITNLTRSFQQFFESKGIRVDLEGLAETNPSFLGFQMDLEAIVVNLLTNAVEALRFTEPDQKQIRVRSAILPEGVVQIQFADSGRGIPEVNASDIFNPMFSTRVDASGRPVGTGMGLAIVKSVLTNYEGKVEVECVSDLGGAQFTILFPLGVPER